MVKVNDEKLLAEVDSLKERIEHSEDLAHKEALEFGQAHNWNDELVDDMAKLLIDKDDRFNVSEQQKQLDYLNQFLEEVKDEPTEESTKDEATETTQNEVPII